MTEPPIHLLDINVALALLDQAHVHNEIVEEWFDTPGLQWALCAFTEAGILRFLTRPKTGGMSMEQVTLMLQRLQQQPGYHYQPITGEWQTLTRPFFNRLHGHNQVTDAYLLGLAVREGLVLTTLDKALLHLAGEHKTTHPPPPAKLNRPNHPPEPPKHSINATGVSLQNLVVRECIGDFPSTGSNHRPNAGNRPMHSRARLTYPQHQSVNAGFGSWASPAATRKRTSITDDKATRSVPDPKSPGAVLCSNPENRPPRVLARRQSAKVCSSRILL